MTQQQGIQVPQFQAPPPLPHFESPLGALVRFLSLASFSSFILIRFDVLYSMQVLYTPSFSHSQPNELRDTPRGSSDHSNHPNNGATARFLLVRVHYVMHEECVVNFGMHCLHSDINVVMYCYLCLRRCPF
jgi:hypothetical protein